MNNRVLQWQSLTTLFQLKYIKKTFQTNLFVKYRVCSLSQRSPGLLLFLFYNRLVGNLYCDLSKINFFHILQSMNQDRGCTCPLPINTKAKIDLQHFIALLLTYILIHSLTARIKNIADIYHGNLSAIISQCSCF